ncbi:hypothetical protein C8J98_104192 [Luteibacter sp. OK325]|uniref:nuclear transport factor 2 family protein n=1 Tax=Luteibacter sp. OK325 TaxID=2135670 RepID=UPI000D3BC3BD|nr:nuclear transport factor 2 family protein [Luteibacter sp. OK325]PTR32981.1 hypothetical protein C8J98_104192 [Luteibacter sp. OK325]
MIARRVFLVGFLDLVASGAHAACLERGVEPGPTAVVDAQFAYYNAHNVEAFAGCYAENVEMVYLDSSQPAIRGRAELLEKFAFLRTMPKEMGVQIVQRTLAGPTVIDKEHVVGLPSGKVVPDMAAIYEVRDGQIVKVWFPPSH